MGLCSSLWGWLSLEFSPGGTGCGEVPHDGCDTTKEQINCYIHSSRLLQALPWGNCPPWGNCLPWGNCPPWGNFPPRGNCLPWGNCPNCPPWGNFPPWGNCLPWGNCPGRHVVPLGHWAVMACFSVTRQSKGCLQISALILVCGSTPTTISYPFPCNTVGYPFLYSPSAAISPHLLHALLCLAASPLLPQPSQPPHNTPSPSIPSALRPPAPSFLHIHPALPSQRDSLLQLFTITRRLLPVGGKIGNSYIHSWAKLITFQTTWAPRNRCSAGPTGDPPPASCRAWGSLQEGLCTAANGSKSEGALVLFCLFHP